MSDLIIYEHPLSERIRTFLRLEHLLEQMAFHAPDTNIWSSRAAVSSLLDIISIFSRGDLKTEILKELERHATRLSGIQSRPGVDMKALGRVLDDLEDASDRIHRIPGQIGQPVRDNEFLKSIMQRSSIPGGSCEFDLPQYHYWLEQAPALRRQQLEVWLTELAPIRDSIVLLLTLIRNSTHPTTEAAEHGFFQHSLDSQSPTQLLRVGIDARFPLFVEISGSKHRFNLRFMEFADNERPTQTQRDVPFSLTCCSI